MAHRQIQLTILGAHPLLYVPFLPPFFLLFSFLPAISPLPLPLPKIQLGSLGRAVSFPSGSRCSQATKWVFLHFSHFKSNFD